MKVAAQRRGAAVNKPALSHSRHCTRSMHTRARAPLERRRVDPLAAQRARLGAHRLDEHADRHARGERVRVDDEVGADAGAVVEVLVLLVVLLLVVVLVVLVLVWR